MLRAWRLPHSANFPARLLCTARQARAQLSPDDKAVVVQPLRPAPSTSPLLGWYLRMLQNHPIGTKSVTACTIYASADLTCQGICASQEDGESPIWDMPRTLRMAAFGFFVSGPTLHVWFNFLAKMLPKRDMFSVFKKMVLGQTVYGPTFSAVFFSANALAQGETTREIAGRLRRDVIPTLKNGLVYWPVCDFLTYRYVPLHLQQRRAFVQLRTNLEVADNSGARRVQCIKVLGGGSGATLGDSIIASVKDATPRGKVKKGEVVNCVIVRTSMQKQRNDGSEIRFDSNAVVIVNKQGEPVGTRIFGPVPHELRSRSLVKILTMAEHVA